MKVKRKVKIGSKDFLNIFTSRNLTLKQKVLTNFTFIEDVDGNYFLAESIPLWVKYLYVILQPLILVIVLILYGARGCVEVYKDSKETLNRGYTRIDECRHGEEYTDKLKKLAKWEN